MFCSSAQINEKSGISAIVENHVRRAAIAPFENAMRVGPVLFERFAFIRKHRRAAFCDRGCCVILR